MSETASKTITVATVLCGVCSVLVAGAVVLLKPKQEKNKELDFKKNILVSANLYTNDKEINEVYDSSVTEIVIDLDSGNLDTDLDAKKFDQARADKDPNIMEELISSDDLAGIKRRAKKQKAFLIKKDGSLDQVVLHVYGKGLWSTMKGFLAVDKDGTTIRGFNYYSHGETPGLGGEIDNPKWKAQWVGKKLFDDSGEFHPKTKVVKGTVNPADPNAAYMIDGLSGATLTSVGVEKTFSFWLSKKGYGSFLAKVKNGEIQ